MSDRPFHHGNLRTVLLEQAEQVVRHRGIDALSLRELARDAGVSHGAPRTHFVDRRALMDALAERGFTRLADAMRDAAAASSDDYVALLRASAQAYVEFAVTDAHLLELMFLVKADDPSDAVEAAAQRFFLTVREQLVRGVESGEFAGADLNRLTRYVSATLQGVAAVTLSWRLSAAQRATLIDDAITGFLTPQR
jgi:AcrR family transcriptional regulator